MKTNNTTIKRIEMANKTAMQETKQMIVPIVLGTTIGCTIRVVTNQKEHLLRDALAVSGGLIAANYIGGLVYNYIDSKRYFNDEFEDEFSDDDEIIAKIIEEEECC